LELSAPFFVDYVKVNISDEGKLNASPNGSNSSGRSTACAVAKLLLDFILRSFHAALENPKLQREFNSQI
jgi:hypothetical protein